jgi:transcriptional regulator with XRE-family HTH domain
MTLLSNRRQYEEQWLFMGIPSGAAAADGRGEFGELVRSQRLATGLTQEELAERSGLGVRTISDIERGRIGRPHRRSVELLCDALGLAAPGADKTAYSATGGTAASHLGHGAVASGAQRLSVVPRQLPATIRNFAGRADELKLLDGLLEGVDGPAGTTVIAAISGTADVSKTTRVPKHTRRRARKTNLVLVVSAEDADNPELASVIDALLKCLHALGGGHSHPDRA